MSDANEIRSALSHIDPHDRDLWLRMGAAIKDELGDSGFDVWDQWSSKAQNYESKSAKTAWRSLKPGHVRINTVFYEAIRHGYQPAQPYLPPSAEVTAKQRSEAEQKRFQEAETQKQAQGKAKHTAQYLWQNAIPAELSHPYLIAKGITDPNSIKGLRQNFYKEEQNLLIPIYQNREIVSMQFINQHGDKRFLSNGQMKGSYSLIGDAKNMNDGFYMVEGFATGASVHAATGKPVVIAFNAGNLVNVADTLKQRFPETQIMIAADNDVSETGVTKAKEAAKVLGDNVNVVHPYFTIEQINRYQQQHGEDKLPSDFNDLHALAGLDTVKSLLTGDKIPIMEPDKNTESQQAADQAAFLHPEEKQSAAIPLDQETASQSAEKESMAEDKPQETKAQSEPEQETNSIELDVERLLEMSREQQKKNSAEASPQKSADTPSQQPGVNNWLNKVSELFASKKQPAQQPAQQQEPSPLSQQALKKIITDLNYRMPPAGMERRYLVSNGQYLSADNATTVLFEDKGKKLSTARTDTQIAQDMLDVAKTKGWEAIKLSGTKEFKQIMYVLAESQGIRTKGYSPTEADLTLVERLRSEHSLNNIEQSATRQQPAQPVHTADGPVTDHQGAPTADSSVASQQPDQTPGPTGEKIVSYGHAPYLHDTENKESHYLTLEKNGNERTVWGVGLPDALEKSHAQVGDFIELHNKGQQEVEVETPVKDENGNIIGTETLSTHRNVWEIDVLSRSQGERLPTQEQEEQRHTQPDVDVISKADKMKAQSSLPTAGQIETSPKADTDVDVPLQEIGQGKIPSEVINQAQDIKTHALATDIVMVAKSDYEGKAAHLSKSDKAKLRFYERNTMDAIHDLKDDARQNALRNYYEHMSSRMDRNQLAMPAPMQVASRSTVSSANRTQQTKEKTLDHEVER